MKKVTRRLAAGVSAAALLVSAVGFDAFTDLIMRPASADDASSYPKTGKSTGFANLEQDTDKDDNYNTGYGLHTNKTASAVGDDGRTFDVGLESWYVGENPVDVATILDASGSMAWTVDTLEPLKLGFNYEEVEKYLKDKDDLNKYEDIENKETKLLTAIQDENGGYLPQDVVDLILDKTKTDNSKLSYADYMYYVYEARPSVAEFVPLGYWDGGNDPANAIQPIAYYSFDNTLRNDVTGGSAKYIVQSNTTIDPEKIAASIPVEYSNGGLDLYETDHNGNVVIDISSLQGRDFNISFQISAADKHTTCYNTPLVYVGNSTKTDYYALYRGDSASATSTRNANKFRIVNEAKPGGAKGSITYDNWIDCTMTFTYDSASSQYTISCKAGSTDMPTNDNDELKLIDKDFYLILGGNELLQYSGSDEGTDISKNKIRNLKITSDSGTVANFPLTANLNNTVTSEIGNATLMENSTDSTFNVTTAIEPTPLDPVYKNGGLDLNETAKNGAIMLDVVPTIAGDTDGFTISMKIRKNKVSLTNTQQNIFYLGDKDISKNDYYQFFRSAKAPGFLALTKGNQNDFSTATPTEDTNAKDNYMFYKGGVATEDKWFTSTLVFTPNGAGKFTVTPYVDGKKADDSENILTLDSLSSIDPVFLLGALQSDASDSREHFIDDLYIFNEALTEDQISRLAGSEGSKLSDPKVYQESSGECGKSHAIPAGGTEDDAFAQITPDLAGNPFKSQREGWYYVNSHSNWSDISGCLKSGKQYYGVLNDAYLNIDPNNAATLGDTNEDHKVTHVEEDISNNNKSIATVPSVYAAANESSDTSGETTHYKELYKNLQDGNDLNREFTPSAVERSLQFYVDNVGYLRCFYCTGEKSWKQSGSTWKYETRTFCSVVYEKGKNADGTDQITKYEALNNALNEFYKNLATESDLSNSAVVRFSTHNLMEKDADKRLKSLIIKNWTNWSDHYQALSADEKTKTDEELKSEYMKDLLIPADGETSVPAEGNEYPYVMTGGTYTWTGLKAFYDNMVNPDTSDNREKIRNIANDARDKYLIIFTDGRDNNFGTSNTKYNNMYGPDSKTFEKDSDLAKAWADKLKEEGYTIYCVMMAAGSISPTANEGEYKNAKEFVTSLAGKEINDKDAAKYVSVIGAGAGESDDSDVESVEEAFQNILEQIQQPRKDYTVQDYIDPRFDLVDKDGNLYQLGAGGNITVSNGTTKKVGNVIDALNKEPTMTADECEELGLAYTPIGSYMVNRQVTTDTTTFPDGYDKGDGKGTGYLYYDDVKDMYYLRWTDQIIPMEDEAFDTATDPKNKKLDIWSATIRLKAKDDFIGGNNILTNGNEAGENLVYSDATIKNMDKNVNLYYSEAEIKEFTDGKPTYRQKLEALSGTNRKINAVDADGVSQAVYGDGIDIPSSGFPRTTVNVRLLKLNAKNLNDVIYMGEVVSPTMMLADLENDYMTGSYYLQYLERYAYRVYGEEAGNTPLIELLNKWLKINDASQQEKTFTIPYIYLPDPEYNSDGTLDTDTTGKVKLQNSTGASWDKEGKDIDFTDPNLRDVTGFITYTWMRDNGNVEKQQDTTDSKNPTKQINDITIDYVVKNTEQIKYNLQLKFTLLKQEDLPATFNLGSIFITAEGGKPGDKFFAIDKTKDSTNYLEFTDKDASGDPLEKWTVDFNRTDYLKAMVQETHTYEPHVMYDADAVGGGKWVLVDEKSDNFKSENAVEAYKDADKSKQTTANTDDKTVTDKGVYDWDPGYKEAPGNAQLEGGTAGEDVKNIKGFYTDTPDNVKLLDATGKTELTNDNGEVIGTEPVSLTANTTYTKDIVNAALALELFVDGKYLKDDLPLKETGKTFTFEATRYYKDPNDPPPYDKDGNIGANATGQKYQLKFKVNELPDKPQPNEIYQVWATLEEVKVENPVSSGDYKPITADGYTDLDALPIGTYAISVGNMEDGGTSSQYYLGKNGINDEYFKYLKTDSTASNYKYDKFPDSVYKVSKDAATDTNDGEYLILNGSTDNSPKNIAENDRKKVADTQTATFYFGTVESRKVGTETLYNTKGESAKDYLKEHPNDKQLTGFKDDYAKDRLGIIMLSADNNSLAITKKVTNTSDNSHDNDFWNFTVTVTPTAGEDADEFKAKNVGGFKLTWYRDGEYQTNSDMGSYYDGGTYPDAITFTDSDNDGKYTATIYLKHNEKVVINGLQDGKWQVTENITGFVCTPHNNQSGWGDSWEYHNSPATDENTLTPLSQVDFVNEFPYALPSAGGDGINLTVYTGIVLILAGGIWLILLRRKAHSRDKPSEGGCP